MIAIHPQFLISSHQSGRFMKLLSYLQKFSIDFFYYPQMKFLLFCLTVGGSPGKLLHKKKTLFKFSSRRPLINESSSYRRQMLLSL